MGESLTRVKVPALLGEKGVITTPFYQAVRNRYYFLALSRPVERLLATVGCLDLS